MKKILVLTLCFVFATTLFVGCNKEKAVNKTGEEKNMSDREELEKNMFGWEIPNETIQISHFYASAQNPDKTEKETKAMREYLLKEFNVELNKIVYDTDSNERLNLMLASNKYPDIITGLSLQEAKKWADLGKAIELSQYIESDSELSNKYGEILNRFTDKEGKIYYLSSGWGFLPIPDYAVHIRYDYWKELGEPSVATPEEYFNVLKQMQALHSTNENGEKVYALSTRGWNNTFNTLAGIWGIKDGYKENANHELTHWVNTPEGLEMALWINQFHLNDMLDPDSFINKFEDWKAKTSNERILGHIGGWWTTWNAGHEVWQKTDENWTEEKRFIQVKVKSENVDEAYYTPVNTTGGSYTIITDKCKDPESVIKWFNFEISDMGTKLMGWGVPNTENSLWNTDGTEWSFVEEKKQDVINSTLDYTNLQETVSGGRFCLVGGTGLKEDKTTYYFDQNFNDLAKWKKLMNDNLADTIYDHSAFKGIVFPPQERATFIKQQVKDMLLSGWAEVVTASSQEECETKFFELRDKLSNVGIKELEEFVTTQYKANLERYYK
ncbi:sugar ABC transporter substrate-binding protein [Vallitalea guaymasensis]|uniref:sugar ABC transporter substrate-binding protein n=1 Tax=Vallitalea guaymasensis TaxID=1185412 RepID=UPI00272A87B3|nr:sugar ABC transporter substrate-binding protein [Vallitalea guaymasensis]